MLHLPNLSPLTFFEIASTDYINSIAILYRKKQKPPRAKVLRGRKLPCFVSIILAFLFDLLRNSFLLGFLRMQVFTSFHSVSVVHLLHSYELQHKKRTPPLYLICERKYISTSPCFVSIILAFLFDLLRNSFLLGFLRMQVFTSFHSVSVVHLLHSYELQHKKRTPPLYLICERKYISTSPCFVSIILAFL